MTIVIVKNKEGEIIGLFTNWSKAQAMFYEVRGSYGIEMPVE